MRRWCLWVLVLSCIQGREWEQKQVAALKQKHCVLTVLPSNNPSLKSCWTQPVRKPNTASLPPAAACWRMRKDEEAQCWSESEDQVVSLVAQSTTAEIDPDLWPLWHRTVKTGSNYPDCQQVWWHLSDNSCLQKKHNTHAYAQFPPKLESERKLFRGSDEEICILTNWRSLVCFFFKRITRDNLTTMIYQPSAVPQVLQQRRP